jgi:hypothetical protein
VCDDQDGDGEHFYGGRDIPGGSKLWFQDATVFLDKAHDAESPGEYQVSIWVLVDSISTKKRKKHWKRMNSMYTAALHRN